MLTIKLKLNHNPIYYSTIGSEPYSMLILAMFFGLEMCGGGFSFFYKWMTNPKLIETGGNVTSLEKINNNNDVYIYLNIDSELYYSDPEKHSITIPLDQLIKITNQWDELIKILPPFIIIKQEGNIFDMIASQE